MSGLQIFFWGFIGGIGAEAIVLHSIRYHGPNDFPFWIKSPLYWIAIVIMALFGGGVAFAYSASGFTLSPLLAIHIGASTPLILRRAREAIPKLPPDPSKTD